MLPRPIRYRRLRRTDFSAVQALLAASGLPAPAPERAALSCFRRLAADLGSDLYLATADSRLLGVVHLTYARQLFRPPQARLEMLVVAPGDRGRGVGRGLAELAAARARRRGCAVIACVVAGQGGDAGTFFEHIGWRGAGAVVELGLAAGAAHGRIEQWRD